MAKNDYLKPWSFNPVFTPMLTGLGISSKIGQPENIQNVWKLPPPFSIVNIISFFQADSLQNSVANQLFPTDNADKLKVLLRSEEDVSRILTKSFKKITNGKKKMA